MPPTAEDTADYLIFFDQLFDSVNSSSIEAPEGKVLKGAITAETTHEEFWRNAITVFSSMEFVGAGGVKKPPTISYWIRTLKGFICIWRDLKARGFNYLCLRNFNQDPLENFFGCIRSHGVRNVNPTCASFKNSFKSLIVNNFMSSRSRNGNCELDSGEALDTLTRFVMNAPETSESDTLRVDFSSIPQYTHAGSASLTNQIENTHAYIAGYLAKRIIKTVKNCSFCKVQLLVTHTDSSSTFISSMEYRPNLLLRPNTTFTNMFSQLVHLNSFFISKFITFDRIAARLVIASKRHLPNRLQSCKEHNL